MPYNINPDIKYGHLEVVDVPEIVRNCTEKWFNQTLTQVNDSVVRIGILEGEFHWHKHDKEDEFFFVLEGTLYIDLRDRTIVLEPHQGTTIPKGVEHRPRAPKKIVTLMVETKSIEPLGDNDDENWLYERTADNKARFVLGPKGKKPLVCFGINPSIAAPNVTDSTIRSVERIAKKNGFDSWIMLNIYPQRATDPKDLHPVMDKHLHEQNLKHIRQILKEYKPTIWAAWGTTITKRSYLMDCLRDIYEATHDLDCTWVTFGKCCKDGHPHHPLYLADDMKSESFDTKMYLAKLLT